MPPNEPPNIRKMVKERDVEGLIESLKTTSSKVRAAAAEALGKLQDVRAIEPLISAYEHTEGIPEHKIILSALKELRWDPGQDNRVVAAAYWLYQGNRKKFIEVGESGIHPLMEILCKLDIHIEKTRVNEVLEMLGEIGNPRTVGPLIAKVDLVEKDLSYDAAVALGKLGDIRGISVLVDHYVYHSNKYNLGPIKKDIDSTTKIIGTLDALLELERCLINTPMPSSSAEPDDPLVVFLRETRIRIRRFSTNQD
jgi:hypothetical protein